VGFTGTHGFELLGSRLQNHVHLLRFLNQQTLVLRIHRRELTLVQVALRLHLVQQLLHVPILLPARLNIGLHAHHCRLELTHHVLRGLLAHLCILQLSVL